MKSRVEAAYFIVVGVLLLAAGAWSYASASPIFSFDDSLKPVECGGVTFPIDPARTVIKGVASAKAYFLGDKMLDELAKVRYDILIVNDP